MKSDKVERPDAAKKSFLGSVLPYEKPKIYKVQLFADEVLDTCNKAIQDCNGIPSQGRS